MISALAFGIAVQLPLLGAQLVPTGALRLSFDEEMVRLLGRDFPSIFNWCTAAVGSLIAGLIVGLCPTIKPVETLQWSNTRAWNGLVLGLRRWSLISFKYAAFTGLAAGPLVGVIFAFNFIRDGFHRESSVVSTSGVIGVLIGAVTVLLIVRPSDWFNRRPRDRMRIRWGNSLISGSIVGAAFGPFLGMSHGILAGLAFGTIAGLAIGAISGLEADFLSAPFRTHMEAYRGS